MQSNITTGDLRFSVSEVQVNNNLDAYMRSYRPQSGYDTKIIVKEEEKSKSEKVDAATDSLYYMAYFKWYWDRYGFFTACKAFFFPKIRNLITFNIFYGIGLAIGAFFFKRLIIRYGIEKYLA